MKSQAVLSAHKCSVGISVERALTTPPRSNVNCQSRTNGCYSSSVVLNVRDEKIYPLKAAVTDLSISTPQQGALKQPPQRTMEAL